MSYNVEIIIYGNVSSLQLQMKNIETYKLMWPVCAGIIT